MSSVARHRKRSSFSQRIDVQRAVLATQVNTLGRPRFISLRAFTWVSNRLFRIVFLSIPLCTHSRHRFHIPLPIIYHTVPLLFAFRDRQKMPLPSLHPLPANPTTGQQPLATLGGRGIAGPPPLSAAGGGGVNREVLKGLQDVAWSDDEVGLSFRINLRGKQWALRRQWTRPKFDSASLEGGHSPVYAVDRRVDSASITDGRRVTFRARLTVPSFRRTTPTASCARSLSTCRISTSSPASVVCR